MSDAKTRVLLVSSSYPDRVNPSSAVFVRDQAELMTSEFDVAVLVPRVAGCRHAMLHGLPKVNLSNEKGVTVCRSLAWHPPLRPRPLARYWLRPPPDASSGPSLANPILDLVVGRFLIAAHRGFNKLLRAWGTPDIVHGHFALPGGWLALTLAKRLDVPMLITEHTSPFEVLIETPLRRRLLGETLRSATEVLAVSPYQATKISRFEPSVRAEVIGNLIRTDRFTPGPGLHPDAMPRRFRFLTVAQLTARKRIDLLLESAAVLRRTSQMEFELWIGGDGPELPRLRRTASMLNLGSQVNFLGSLLPNDVCDAIRRCDVFVLPSRDESFGIVLGEAMACGKPVVATRCGGPEFFVNDTNGLLIPVDDANALAEAMETLANSWGAYDPEVIRAQIVERFGIESFRNRTAAIYRRSVRGRTSHMSATQIPKA